MREITGRQATISSLTHRAPKDSERTYNASTWEQYLDLYGRKWKDKIKNFLIRSFTIWAVYAVIL